MTVFWLYIYIGLIYNQDREQLTKEFKMQENEYNVKWEIDVSATSKLEAAKKALRMIIDQESIAHAFKVAIASDNCYDLIDLDNENSKATLIEYITKTVTEYGKSISMAEIEAQSPIVDTIGKDYRSVEVLNVDTVEVWNYINCNVTNTVSVKYTDLELDVLDEITTELENM